MKKAKSDYVIQTVTNALALLEEFDGERELGVTELSRRLVLHKNNVFRLLATLEQRGYIEQSRESDRYRLGVRCLELGQSYGRNCDLVRMARPYVEELARDTSESAHLGVLREHEVIHLHAEQTERLVMSGSRIGRRLPAHCTALGKVLLGCARDRVIGEYDERRIGSGLLDGRTPHTITDRDKLLDELRAVAGQGYAVDLEECEPGLRCAAAPVFDERGDAVAALSVSGPAFRFSDDHLIQEFVPAVTATAGRLSAALGYASAST